MKGEGGCAELSLGIRYIFFCIILSVIFMKYEVYAAGKFLSGLGRLWCSFFFFT